MEQAAIQFQQLMTGAMAIIICVCDAGVLVSAHAHVPDGVFGVLSVLAVRIPPP